MTIALKALAQEPWCYLPHQIACLTDWQVLELYLKPAAKRAEEMRREMQVNNPHSQTYTSMDTPVSSAPAGLPDRETFIAIQMDCFGNPREKAEADYDAIVKSMRGR